MSASKSASQFDVLIVGGGMAGLLLARLLDMPGFAGRQSPLSVGVVEPRPPAPRASDAPLDLRVSALAPASLELLARVGCLSRLSSAVCNPYERMRVWQDGGGPDGSHALTFDAAESGVAALGSIVENHAVRAVLWNQLSQSTTVQLFTATLQSVRETPTACEVHCDSVELRARLLVGADGIHSKVREQLGIPGRQRAYQQNALVAHLASERAHGNTAWQKFLPDGPAALLPLADGRSSLVWSHPQSLSAELLALSDEQFAARLEEQLDGVLGKLQCTTSRVAFPLARDHADCYTGRRFALIGDAAHRVHPLAGQGANLGFRDVAVLADELGRHWRSPWADPGDPRVLRRYERRRKGDNALTLGAMDGLNAIFSSPLASLAGAGLGWVNRSRPLKAFFATRAMGTNESHESGRG